MQYKMIGAPHYSPASINVHSPEDAWESKLVGPACGVIVAGLQEVVQLKLCLRAVGVEEAGKCLAHTSVEVAACELV